MGAFIHVMESAVQMLATVGCSLVDLAGIVILLISVVQALIGYFGRNPHIRLNLAEGIALALEFKLGGEVLRTVVARDWNDLLMIGGIILLRASLSMLLHWEIKNEKNHTNLLHPEYTAEENQSKVSA